MPKSIKELKAEAVRLSGLVQAGTATDEEIAALTDLTTTIKSRSQAIADAAEAVADATVTAVEPAAEPAAEERTDLTAGEYFVRNAKIDNGRSNKVAIPFQERATTTANLAVLHTQSEIAVPAIDTSLLSAVTVETVNTNSVDVIRRVITNNAATVAEGNAKPESSVVYEVETVALKTKAHTADITRQAAEDDSRLAATINGDLTNGIVAAIQGEIATAFVANEDIASIEAPNYVTGARVAQASVQAAGFTGAQFIVANPVTFANIDIELLNATTSGALVGKDLWNLTRIASPSIPEGDVYVGDTKAAAKLFRRSEIFTALTDSDKDKFGKNILTLLAEARVYAGVVTPAAVRKVVIVPVA
jgi:HK97 family phage major capsid protein